MGEAADKWTREHGTGIWRYHAESAQDFLSSVRLGDSYGSYIYRGHRDSSFELVPSVWRDAPNWLVSFRQETAALLDADRQETAALLDEELGTGRSDRPYTEVEGRLVAEFLTRANELGHRIPSGSPKHRYTRPLDELRRYDANLFGMYNVGLDVSDIALAQHSGIPTSLLDWSEGASIAAFFATDGEPGESVSVWGLDRSLEFRFGPERTRNTGDFNFIRTVGYGNHNLVAQRGVFTRIYFRDRDSPPNVERFVEALGEPQSGAGPVLYEVIVKRHYLQEVRRLLALDGYTRATLYPGLKSVADEIVGFRERGI